jgi:ATP-binding cassette subfamily B protein
MTSANHSQMIKFRESLILVTYYVRILGRSLPLLWVAAPKETGFLATTLLLQSVIPAVSVWINKQVVDNIAFILSPGVSPSIWAFAGLVGAWAIATFLESFLPPWSELANINLEEKLTAHLQLRLMEKVDIFVDLVRFEDASFYDELQVIQESVAHEPASLLAALSQITRELLTVVTMLVLLAPLGWWVPLLVLATSFPQIYVSFRIRWELWDAMSNNSPQSRRMQYYASIMLTDTYAKEVRLFGLGDFFRDRYLKAFQDKFQSMRHLRGKQAIWLTLLGILSASGNATVFAWIVLQAVSGNLTPGNVLLFVQSLNYIQQNLLYAINGASILQRSLLFMERFFKFMDSQPTMITLISSKSVSNPVQSSITFKNVHFTYPDGRIALTGVSFTLHSGETVALVGENGAGKTTLVKLLARLYDPTQGDIWVDGKNLKHLDLEAWRQQIGVVFQDFCRYALTIGENIALGDLTTLNCPAHLQKAAHRAGIASKVEQFPDCYNTMLGKQFDGTELSGGEWQKIALARAFIRQDSSQILVLDEPTAALDPRSESEIYSRFADLAHGKTTLLVTHRLASVKMADRILVLKAGKLIEAGTHEQLLKQQGEYATLWRMQAEHYGF